LQMLHWKGLLRSPGPRSDVYEVLRSLCSQIGYWLRLVVGGLMNIWKRGVCLMLSVMVWLTTQVESMISLRAPSSESSV
jgi:hypothetical protein